MRGGGQSKTLKQRLTEAKDGDVIDLGKENFYIEENDSYTINKAITIKNGDTKHGTFTVESTGTKLLNLKNIQSIIADEEIQEGNLNIVNCFEIDSIYVNGGGANSIHISSTTVSNLYVKKENVRVVLEASVETEEGSGEEGQSVTATVKNIQIKTDCKLDSTDKNAIFENVQISSDVEKVTLAGSANIDKILAETNENATVEIESAEVKIEKTSENVKLVVAENSQIQIPSVDKIDTYYTVTVLAYPFAQSSMKLPEGFLFSTEEITYEDVQLEGWYLDSLFTQKATFPHVVNSDVTFYAKFILDLDKTVISQEDFEFSVGTWLCEQTIQDGNPAEMLQTTNSKIIFTITETSPTATIQAIVEKYETIITYGSEFSSSYEQAKKQYPSSMPEYEFSFDDKNLTFTAIATKESLDKSSTGYNGLTYEEFVSGYLTFDDTIENFTNSEKTILKSINNYDSDTKIETIFVKISESK